MPVLLFQVLVGVALVGSTLAAVVTVGVLCVTAGLAPASTANQHPSRRIKAG